MRGLVKTEHLSTGHHQPSANGCFFPKMTSEVGGNFNVVWSGQNLSHLYRVRHQYHFSRNR